MSHPKIIPLLKYIFAWILLASSAVALAQPGKPSVKNIVTVDKVPSAAAIGSSKVVIAPDSAFSIGGGFATVSGAQTQNALCKDGKASWMQFGKARLDGDTLYVALYRAERAYVHVLHITIWNKEFHTKYQIMARDGLSAVTVVATDQVLVMEHLKFDHGREVTGFVNFRGTRWEAKLPDRPWEAKQDWVESAYVVRGPFKITID